MNDINFTTPYLTPYTKSNLSKSDNEFKTNYSIINADTINTAISIQSRDKRERFKSKLIAKE